MSAARNSLAIRFTPGTVDKSRHRGRAIDKRKLQALPLGLSTVAIVVVLGFDRSVQTSSATEPGKSVPS